MKIRKIAQTPGVVATVVDNLNSESAIDALSAKQGKELKNLIENIGPVAQGGLENFPIGTTVQYDGDTVPEGWEAVEIDDIKVSITEPTTGEKVWIKHGKNLFDINGSHTPNPVLLTTGYTISGTKVILPSTSGNSGFLWFDKLYKNDGPYTISIKRPSGGMSRIIIQPQTASGSIVTDLSLAGGTYNAGAYQAYYFDSNTERMVLHLNLPSTVAAFKIGLVAIAWTADEIQVERGLTVTAYEPHVEKAIYCKNDNGIYEEFYKELQTAIIDISLETGSGSASFPEGFTVENCVIVGHKDKNKYGVPFGNTPQIEVMLNGDNNNIQATGTGNFSGNAAKTQIILMKI